MLAVVISYPLHFFFFYRFSNKTRRTRVATLHVWNVNISSGIFRDEKNNSRVHSAGVHKRGMGRDNGDFRKWLRARVSGPGVTTPDRSDSGSARGEGGGGGRLGPVGGRRRSIRTIRLACYYTVAVYIYMCVHHFFFFFILSIPTGIILYIFSTRYHLFFPTRRFIIARDHRDVYTIYAHLFRPRSQTWFYYYYVYEKTSNYILYRVVFFFFFRICFSRLSVYYRPSGLPPEPTDGVWLFHCCRIRQPYPVRFFSLTRSRHVSVTLSARTH